MQIILNKVDKLLMKHENNESLEQLFITDEACEWIETHAQLFMTTDMVLAYVFYITPKIAMVVTVDGLMWDFINVKAKKQLTAHQMYRLIKKLVKKYHLMEWRIEPFPELARDRNLKYNIDDAIIVDANYFQTYEQN